VHVRNLLMLAPQVEYLDEEELGFGPEDDLEDMDAGDGGSPLSSEEEDDDDDDDDDRLGGASSGDSSDEEPAEPKGKAQKRAGRPPRRQRPGSNLSTLHYLRVIFLGLSYDLGWDGVGLSALQFPGGVICHLTSVKVHGGFSVIVCS
jgi:hypothetical protein